MKIICNKKIYSILVLGAMLLPGSALASSVYINTNHSEFFVGDTVLFNVRVDSEGKNINAVEGEVLLDHAADSVSLTDITTSSSAFSLWPSKPLLSERKTRISFAGGSPGGFVSRDAVVFNIVLKLQKAGKVALSPNNIGVYLNDGKGTEDKVRVQDLIVDVLPRESDSKAVDDWSNIVLNDKTLPEPFEIYAGQEGSVFDGKKFLSFSTTDGQSGISYYEVIEGDLPPARSSNTYVLQEQNKPVKVTIVAYDSAGNVRESVYNSPTSIVSYAAVIIFIGILFLIVLLFVVYRKTRKVQK